MKEKKKPAVFLDRDGVLTVERKRIALPQEVELYPFVKEAIDCLKKAGYLTIVVTNQSGVARGLYKEEELVLLHERIKKQTGIDEVYYCPHHPEGVVKKYKKVCDCRKPALGMIRKAQEEYLIDMKNSWMIGDRTSDVMLGKAAGLQTILVKTGYGEIVSMETEADYVENNLVDAVRTIEKMGRRYEYRE